jgi:acyl dehydratase
MFLLRERVGRALAPSGRPGLARGSFRCDQGGRKNQPHRAAMPGKYFDQFVIGEVIHHPITRTVTETDNLLFSALTHNPQPLHLDAEAARKSEFGQILVNSTFTFSLMIGVSVGETTLGTLVANLGMDAVVFPKPVFIGDTLRTETTVVDRRESKSRPTQGIVVFEHRSINQRGEVVAQCRRSALLHKAPEASRA